VLKNGLQFQLGYSMMGFLDILLVPQSVTIPASFGQVQAGTSALYNTRDYKLDGWLATVAYQF
jgi:hypothetical protein